MEQTKTSKKNRPRLFSRDVNDVVRPIDKKLNEEKLLEVKDVQVIEVKKHANNNNKHAVRANR
ncbi:MAG: hypothetical protein CMG60_08060 [Candidatus Marinimicrobia bacterium]|nr:hypothetical protein [Candidatus Neomarinimicrobiota bacterium]|tara:strand:- start:7 stop:195 length:189 start_codon:yes stop_codon:yes gene_type:complete